MKNEKNYMGFHIPKVWQILKRFAVHFHWAQTLKLWGVIMHKKLCSTFFNECLWRFFLLSMYFCSWDWNHWGSCSGVSKKSNSALWRFWQITSPLSCIFPSTVSSKSALHCLTLYFSLSVNCISQTPEMHFSDLVRCISQILSRVFLTDHFRCIFLKCLVKIHRTVCQRTVHHCR